MPKGSVMNIISYSLFTLLITFTVSSAVHAQPASSMNCDRPFEDFSEKTVGAFPEQFTAHDSSHLKRITSRGGYYTVKQDEDQNSYLNALATNDGLIIHKDIENWNLDEYPHLRWRWRARQFPKGGNEKYIRTNDAAAAVYVVWKASSLMRVKSIKFTWSASLDVGTHISKRFALDHVHVMQNQTSAKTGKWIEETVDVRALFRKYYNPTDGKLEQPIAIALLTDSDNTNSVAEADYDDFVLCRGAMESPQPASIVAQ
jgi:hypothetical protein